MTTFSYPSVCTRRHNTSHPCFRNLLVISTTTEPKPISTSTGRLLWLSFLAGSTVRKRDRLLAKLWFASFGVWTTYLIFILFHYQVFVLLNVYATQQVFILVLMTTVLLYKAVSYGSFLRLYTVITNCLGVKSPQAFCGILQESIYSC